MSILDSFDAATTMLLVTVVGACVTYFFNERSKRHELSVTQNAQLRLKAFSQASQKIYTYLTTMLAHLTLAEARDEARPLRERFAKASAVSSNSLKDAGVTTRLFQIADAGDETALKATVRELFIRVGNRLPDDQAAAEQAMFLCRLLSFDEGLAAKLDEVQAAMVECKRAMWEDNELAFMARREGLVARVDEMQRLMAESYARDFRDRW